MEHLELKPSNGLKSLLNPTDLPGSAPVSAPTSPSASDLARRMLAPEPSAPAAESPRVPAESPGTHKPERLKPAATGQLSQITGTLLAVKGQILHDLSTHLSRLLSLNTTRKEMVVAHLDRLAGIASGPATSAGQADALAGLSRWIEGPRLPAQNAALEIYFEEIALFVLGQALLMKAWSDRGLRPFVLSDLRNMNSALNSALQKKIPPDRCEGWQVTRQNLYSWYVNPLPAELVQAIWASFQSWRFSDEGPGFLTTMLAQLRQGGAKGVVGAPNGPDGYDTRFFQALWEAMPRFGFDSTREPGPIRRNWVAFTPTLRDGSLVRSGPVNLHWVALESSAFQLMMAELAQLWWGPSAPPLWMVGSGLEAHTRDQLALGLSSPKPSLLSRIAEMEACDAAFVLEERVLRGQGRALESQRFRELADAIPYFKKLRGPATSLGGLQACVALSKLRPGGLLWWAREEALNGDDGGELLGFLLERARLVCEWDFSELEHQLPGRLPLHPRHLYLLAREPDVELRLSHRPVRVTVRGQIRSHVELPLVLEDALDAPSAAPGAPAREPRGHWEAAAHPSPVAQREWSDRWPDPSSHGRLRELEALRARSLPLAQAATIHATPDGDPARDRAWSVHSTLKGFWIRGDSDGTERRLIAEPLPRPGREARGTGFMILVPDESWTAPLRAYLSSEPVRAWLEHHAERRAGRWVLGEQLVRFIPVPRALWIALGWNESDSPSGEHRSQAPFALPLPGEWEKLAAEAQLRPEAAREALVRLRESRLAADSTGETRAVDPDELERIRATLFARAAGALDRLADDADPLDALVDREGRVRWAQLLRVLPREKLVEVGFSPLAQLSGKLPLHVAITRFERVRAPSPGVLLTTEQGLSLRIASDRALVLDLLTAQLEGVSHPTWSELAKFLKVPRDIDSFESIAREVQLSHRERTGRRGELERLLAESAP
jgi:hypothetical protein